MKPTIAQHYPGDSVLHRLDPRAKIVAVTVLAVALFTRDSFIALAVYAVAAAVGLALSRVPLSWFWRSLKPVIWLVAIAFLAQVAFAPGPSFAHFGPFHLSWRGLELAAYLSLRLVVLVLTGSLLTLTTSPVALTDGLAWLARPLRRLRRGHRGKALAGQHPGCGGSRGSRLMDGVGRPQSRPVRVSRRSEPRAGLDGRTRDPLLPAFPGPRDPEAGLASNRAAPPWAVRRRPPRQPRVRRAGHVGGRPKLREDAS